MALKEYGLIIQKIGALYKRPEASITEKQNRMPPLTAYSTAFTICSTTFFASPNTIIVLSM